MNNKFKGLIPWARLRRTRKDPIVGTLVPALMSRGVTPPYLE